MGIKIKKEWRKEFGAMVPKRPVNAHKGTCGRVGIVAGSSIMMGAALLTAKAALRAGAGTVFLMTIPEAVGMVNTEVPELIVLPLPSDQGTLRRIAVQHIERYIHENRMDCLAIGPGLGRSSNVQEMMQEFVKHSGVNGLPMVMDADALYHVSQSDLKGLPKNKSVITPHFQEFKTLFRGVNLSSSEKNVAEAVKRIQEVVILKGNGSLIGVGETVYKNQTGSSALATAGSGDVLTGLIVGLMAQGVSVEESARLGVFLHGLAGDLAEADLGTHSVIASDIILHISAAFKALIG